MLEARPGQADLARCDGCGAAGECTEDRDLHGQRLRAWLPDGWRLMDGKHLCGACVADDAALFAPQRAAFLTRFFALGRDMVPLIAAEMRVPVAIAWDWVFGCEQGAGVAAAPDHRGRIAA